ncbi:MAG TPA: serine/threonine-protein kinase, partial [Burkholderiales bacterium]|nr:serine/threonine-protein kinase [Burkholderiales bacterium]
MLERVGRYEIRGQIGRGAMGTVFEGFDSSIGRRVAIKMVRTEGFDPSQLPGMLARFKREAQSAGQLSHPNIVTIYEYGEEAGSPYIVMEYIAGQEIGQPMNRGVRFSTDEIERIMSQLLGALAHAHERGVVHRDLKPSNIFLLKDGSIKVVDFGIARIESSDLTETGAMLGTPAYMSPEQCVGRRVDHRSDLFSAGVILYQLLTGDKPFTGSTTTIIQKVLRMDPLPPSELDSTLSPAWDAVIASAMAKMPEARYQSAQEFADAVRGALGPVARAGRGADATEVLRTAVVPPKAEAPAAKPPEQGAAEPPA